MKRRIGIIIGSLAILKRRSAEVGHPGLALYAEAGTAAAVEVSNEIGKLAHRNETTERTIADRLKEILADGKVDAAELQELAKVPQTLTLCAERSHDIGEVAS